MNLVQHMALLWNFLSKCYIVWETVIVLFVKFEWTVHVPCTMLCNYCFHIHLHWDAHVYKENNIFFKIRKQWLSTNRTYQHSCSLWILLYRLLWFCAVGTAWGVFIYVMVTRVEKLNSNLKAVNVEIVQVEDEMEFPTVTICNQNYFR